MIAIAIVIILFFLFYYYRSKEDIIVRRARLGKKIKGRPSLSHIALYPGLSPAEYPWVIEDEIEPSQQKDCSNNIWFPQYYPWYPTFNKSPIA